MFTLPALRACFLKNPGPLGGYRSSRLIAQEQCKIKVGTSS